MSKHLHRNASSGARLLIMMLCLVGSLQWVAAQTTLNTALNVTSNKNIDYIAATGASINIQNAGGYAYPVLQSLTIPAGITVPIAINGAQGAGLKLRLYGEGIVNLTQANPANSREGIVLLNEDFAGNIMWTAARSLFHFSGMNTEGQYGMPNGTFTVRVAAGLYGGAANAGVPERVNVDVKVKIGELQCADSYSGFSLNGAGFQNYAITNMIWEIGAKNTDSYMAGSIKDGQMHTSRGTGYTGLRKVGTGALTLTNGASNYSLGTEVVEGGIYANAASGTVFGKKAANFAQGTFLGGSGLIAAILNGDGAALRPGSAAGEIGKMTINSGSFAWNGGTVDVDVKADACDTLEIIVPDATYFSMVGNTLNVSVLADLNVGDEFPFVTVKTTDETPLPAPTFSAIEVVKLGDGVSQIPVFDLDYLNTTGKLKVTGFSLFTVVPRALAGICAGAPYTISVATLIDGVTLTWEKDGSVIAAAANQTSYVATEPGTYTVTIEKGTASESATCVVENASNPSTIAAGTSYRTDGDSIFVTPNGTETIVGWQWYMTEYDPSVAFDPNNEEKLAYEVNNKFIMSTTAWYAADIYNQWGCMTHLAPTVVKFEPGITLQPVGNAEPLCEGGYVTLSTDATTQAADGIINYQWHYLGDDPTVTPSHETEIAENAKTKTYVARQTGYYIAHLSDARGYIYTDKVYVNIKAIKLANFPTADINECAAGHDFVVTPVSATNEANVFTAATYKWYKDGAVIAGATDSIYSATASGSYKVEVTDGACVKTSKAVTLALSSAGQITTDLSTATITKCAGQDVTLSIAASAASGNLTYQWYKDGAIIRNATAASYNPTESGEYSVNISVDGGCVTSSATTPVVFNKVPTIRTQPAAQEFITGYPGTLCDGQMGDMEVVAVDVTGYQWYKDGQAIAGATNKDYETTTAGTYYVVLTNDGGCSTQSDDVVYVTKVKPTAQIPAINSAVCSGILFELKPTYADVANSYKWFKDDVQIDGAVISNYATRYDGDYFVVAENECGVDTSNVLSINTHTNPAVTISQNYSTLTANVVDPNLATLTYQWTLDEVPIAGATSSQYMVTKRGNYAVKVTNENNCVTTSETKLVGAGVTAANADQQLQAVKAYPNPSTGIFKINGLPVSEAITVQVDNMAGATIFSGNYSGQSEIAIDLSGEPVGMYFVRIIVGGDQTTAKIQIVR